MTFRRNLAAIGAALVLSTPPAFAGDNHNGHWHGDGGWHGGSWGHHGYHWGWNGYGWGWILGPALVAGALAAAPYYYYRPYYGYPYAQPYAYPYGPQLCQGPYGAYPCQ